MPRRLADDIERFIADVTLYLTSAGVLQASAHAGSATWDLAKPAIDAGKKLLAGGRPVAEALEACGGNASTVLTILHHVEGGGGADGGAAADAIRPSWREWKVELQRAAMKLRRGEPLAAAGGGKAAPRKRRRLTPAPAAIADDLITASVAEQDFYASRSTLRAAVADGRLKDYRTKSKKGTRSPLILSRTEVGCHFTQQKK